MVAASVWSLLIPAMEHSDDMGALAFVPAIVGFWLGIALVFVSERLVLNFGAKGYCKNQNSFRRTLITAAAVTLHNFPEGMAVGVVYSGLISGDENASIASALALSVGIAIQNLPEGAVVSLPLHASGVGRTRSFALGVLSGVVEPFGALLTLLLSAWFVPALPYFLSFAAGAMMYVVADELIPAVKDSGRPEAGMLIFAIGFSLMMSLDVVFG